MNVESILLNQVVRLRLFRNTNKELSEYIGYNLLSNNSIRKISPFTAKCIFRELCRETQKQTKQIMTLEEVLEQYRLASAFFEKYIKGRKRLLQTENIYVLLRYCYIDDYQVPEEKAFLKELVEKVYSEELEVAVLLLLMLDVLPLYTSKKGDVGDVMFDLKKVVTFLNEFIGFDETVSCLPVLDRLEKEAREKGCCNRIYLIFIAFEALETYCSYANASNLYTLSTRVARDRITFDVDGSYWVDPEMLSVPSVFWHFESLVTNEYFLYRYVVNTEKKQMVYTRYEAAFTRDNNRQLILSVGHPQAIFGLIERQRMFENISSVFECEIDAADAPDEITLRSLLDNAPEFPTRKLVRLKDEAKVAQLQHCFDSGNYKLQNCFPETEHELYICPPAITEEYLYFKTELDAPPDEKVYYRVPKELNRGLESITVNDDVGLMRLNGRKYIGFIPILLYRDVTDDEARRQNGVDVVTEIVL